MSRPFSIKKYIPYTYKMMIPYLLLVLLTDATIGYLSYSILIQSRTEIAETNIRTGMDQTSGNIRYHMDEVQRLSNTFFTSVPFQRALQKHGDPLQIYYTMIDEIVPELKAPVQLLADPARLILYATNRELISVPGDDLDKPIKGSDYYILPAGGVAGSGWLPTYATDNRWVQVETDRKLGNISHVQRLVSFNDYQTVIGYLRITVRLDDLLGNFGKFPVDKGITLRLIDLSQGTVLYQRGSAAPGPVDKKAFLTMRQAVPGSPFAIETLVPYAYLQKDAKRLQLLIVAICFVSFLGMALIGLLVARLSGRKMTKIVALVRSFQEGNLEKRIRFKGNDEFVQIAGAFNVMANNIKKLINSVYIQGVRRKQAELEALQAQINPHFLYNTLSTISSLANMGETRQVTEMVRRLSKFYRLSLNQGLVSIPLKKELEHVETYLDIQSIKYGDSFAYYLDVDPDIQDAQVIALFLQPFVENVFKHAWFGDKIAIRITGKRREDRIELKVIDNGIGMKPEQVRTMLAGPSEAGGYGLKNVNERIKLRFGDEYGIAVSSRYGAGTTVAVSLPAEFSPPAGGAGRIERIAGQDGQGGDGRGVYDSVGG